MYTTFVMHLSIRMLYDNKDGPMRPKCIFSFYFNRIKIQAILLIVKPRIAERRCVLDKIPVSFFKYSVFKFQFRNL
jgi:hypothetical protein